MSAEALPVSRTSVRGAETADRSFPGRLVELGLPPPHRGLRWCVVVPVRNEEVELPGLLASLELQVDRRGQLLAAESFEVILLLNNCTDSTSLVAQRWSRQFPRLSVHVAEVRLEAPEAHVGRARQMVFDAAYARLRQLGRMDGLILTTDADTRLAPDWIVATQEEIDCGVDAVGGRIEIKPEERRGLTPEVQRLFLLDIGYRRALEEMRHLYAPDAHDPFPRHHQHFGGSLAVTAAIYERAQGMPLAPTSEDVALYRAVLATGGRWRHSFRMRAYTSARIAGRAFGGLADAMAWWQQKAQAHSRVLVESAAHAQRRLQRLGRWRQEHGYGLPPLVLLTTPEPPPEHHAAELHTTLCKLRRRNAALQPLSLKERLEVEL